MVKIKLAITTIFIIFSISIYSQKEIRILCYNVHHCNPPSKKDFIDIEAIAKVINKAKPDLVALQEIDINTERSGKEIDQAKELGQLTGMYSYFAKTIDHQGGDYGIAILSKYPFVTTRKIQLPMEHNTGGEPRAVAAVVVEPTKGDRIIFASTHLDLKEQNKKLQINAIIDYIQDKDYMQDVDYPIILAGDFNSKPDSYVVQELDKVFQRTCMDCPFTIPEIKPNRTIDYISFTPIGTFDIIEHKVIDESYASDHLPVFAVLKRRTNE